MGNRKDSLKHSKAVSTTENRAKGDEASDKQPDTEQPKGGISGWLSSEEGVGWMQFFVVTNAIILLLTTGLPRIWETIDFMTSSSD